MEPLGARGELGARGATRVNGVLVAPLGLVEPLGARGELGALWRHSS